MKSPFGALRIAFAGGALLLASFPASAGVLDLSYLMTTGNTVSIRLQGELSADKNTFGITGVDALSVNGSQVLQPLIVRSVDFLAELVTTDQPIATLDGSIIDFLLRGDLRFGIAYNELAFIVGSHYADLAGGSFVGADPVFGGTGGFQSFVSAAYSASVQSVAIVPEPASMALFGTGVLGLAAVRLRRRS